ncbi:MAG: hypothetical protein GC129_01935 [Proteobacteria bacterium]|nr:hypothetical protein [Pseudomonadota bacterium]
MVKQPKAYLRAAALAVAWLMLCGAAAESFWPDFSPLPQDQLLPLSVEAVAHDRADIDQVMVVVQMGHGDDNPRWLMSQTHMPVLFDKLMTLPQKPMPEDEIWPKLDAPTKSYRGLTVLMKRVDGKRFAPMKVFEGKVTNLQGEMVGPDFGRRLEYWLFGTARVRRDQMLGVSVLPVLSFEQCRLLGQKIVQTSPRQCLLPNNNLLLEVDEKPTLASARITSFDQCLQKGEALIYTFPRRCVAAGGRVFTEPPQVYDNVLTPVATPLAPNAEASVSATMGGLRAVSGSTPPVAPAVVSATVVSDSAVVSVTGPLSDAELQNIMPAAGPAPKRSRSVWKYEWADF